MLEYLMHLARAGLFLPPAMSRKKIAAVVAKAYEGGQMSEVDIYRSSFSNVTKANIRAILDRVLAFFADRDCACEGSKALRAREYGIENINRHPSTALSIAATARF